MARALIAQADAVLGNRYFLQSLPRAERLRWMQSNSMGVDLLVDSAAQRRFVLTNARGVYDDEVADHALALVLALVRGIPLACDAVRTAGPAGPTRCCSEPARSHTRSGDGLATVVVRSGGALRVRVIERDAA